MNNHRLLTGLLTAALLSGGGHIHAQENKVLSIEELFEIAESNSVQLRPSFSAEDEARQEISVAKNARLPEIEAKLSLSYIGDGFITKRDFSDYQKAPIPHLGNGLGINVTQPLYTGGAVTNSIRLAELKSTASRYATELQRDNIRFQLTGFYLDIYKYSNLRNVVENNIGQQTVWAAENGDIYVFSPSYAKTQTEAAQQTRLDAGVCRIPAGTTDFDDYYCNIEQLAGRSFMRCWPAGGNYFILQMYNEPYGSGFSGTAMQLAIFDASAKTLKDVSGLPANLSTIAKNVFVKDGKVYVAVTQTDGKPVIYGINPATAVAQQGITIDATSITGFGYLTPQK